MARPATDRLKVNPALGSLPVLQYCSPDQLLIDEIYQRSLGASCSQTLIRRIAMYWDWSLCQPLFVARRADGNLYVVDGQHRLAAARLRGDIWQLPCVVTSFESSAEDEAASFVALNQQRRPLNKLELFKAALAAGDFEASQIRAGGGRCRSVDRDDHQYRDCAPGMIQNIGGLRNCYRVHGLQVLATALDVMAQAYKGFVLRYAGTIFPGIVAIVAAELERNADFASSDTFALMTEMVGGAEQSEWVSDINLVLAADPTANRRRVAADIFTAAWAECSAEALEEAA
jgi:hypothetical protein